MHPTFLQFGDFTIATYGVLVAIGFALGLWLATRRAKNEEINAEQINSLGVWLILAGMGGGKLFYMLFHWQDFLTGWREDGFGSLRQGFIFYGGFIGATVAAYCFTQAKKLPFLKLADILAPSLALGHAFGRLGCFFNGCCFGKVCDQTFLLAVQFPAMRDQAGKPIGSLPFLDHLYAGWVNVTANRSLPVYPTQLYEVAGNFAIFAALFAFYRHKRFAGQVWWLYVLTYGALRFAVEFSRGDYEHHYFGNFTLGHLIAAILIVVAIIGHEVSRRRS